MPWESGIAFRVLIVDATNTGRSVVGERLLRKHLWARGVGADRIRITSAGLNAEDGATMQDLARDVILEQGGSVQGFRARSLSNAMVESTDLFVVGTGFERDELVRRHPRALGRSFTMSEFAHLYDGLSMIAPLREHAAILERTRRRRDLPSDWELPPWERLEDRAHAVGERINEATMWIADLWAAMAPPHQAMASGSDADSATCLVDAFGVTVAVRCEGSEREALAAAGHRAWGRCVIPDGEPEARVDVMVDRDPALLAEARAKGVLAYPDVERALHYLSSAVTVRAIEQRVGSLVMLHAAGLASPDGDVVGFIAPLGHGQDHAVKNARCPLRLRHRRDPRDRCGPHRAAVPEAAVRARRYEPHQGAVGARVARPHVSAVGAAAVGAPRLVERDASVGSDPMIEELPLLHGLAHLAEQVSYLSRLPQRLHTLADLVDSIGGLVRIRYAESRDLLKLMPSLLEGAR